MLNERIDLMTTAFRLLSGIVGLALVGVVAIPRVRGQNARPAIATDADFRRAMKELSNWGRWGEIDELGAANLITPVKRKQAIALAREGRVVSLSHDVPQEKAADTPTFLDRAVVTAAPNVTLDRYQYTGTYHGVVHSHLDALDCHIMVDGKGYNGVSLEEIKAAGGCPRGSINALKDGVVTRGILFDATRLPGKATPQGWLEPGTAIHSADLEALERLQRVKVSPGDVILLYTSMSRTSSRSAVFHSSAPMGQTMSPPPACRRAWGCTSLRSCRWASASSTTSTSNEPLRKRSA
jgi:hypothetical protein